MRFLAKPRPVVVERFSVVVALRELDNVGRVREEAVAVELRKEEEASRAMERVETEGASREVDCPRVERSMVAGTGRKAKSGA